MGFKKKLKKSREKTYQENFEKHFQGMRDETTGKNALKATKYEQKKQGEVIEKQQQIEKTRMMEQESEIKRRKLATQSGGSRSLLRTLG